ncbi:unnamed protein product [Arctogadus glacialis]
MEGRSERDAGRGSSRPVWSDVCSMWWTRKAFSREEIGTRRRGEGRGGKRRRGEEGGERREEEEGGKRSRMERGGWRQEEEGGGGMQAEEEGGKRRKRRREGREAGGRGGGVSQDNRGWAELRRCSMLIGLQCHLHRPCRSMDSLPASKWCIDHLARGGLDWT